MSVPTRASRAFEATRSARPTRLRLGALLLVVGLSTGLAATVVSAGSLPPCRLTDTTTALRAYTDWDRTLLDVTFRLPATYAPGDLRSTLNAGLNGGNSVRAFVLADLRAMASAAKAAGARLAVQSGYRSYATQRSTFAYWSAVSGYAAALKSSGRAGHSEHQLGTTVDFRSYGGSAPWYYADWGTSRAGAWLRQNAWRYGFVMSYPNGKSSVTCYAYEPWHYRFVGRAMAARIRTSGLTLREYLWRQLTTPTPSATPTPSVTLTDAPGDPASATPIPTDAPPIDPTPIPTETPTPTPEPTAAPTPEVPSSAPSSGPSDEPSPAV
jgi:D-alanyl-D-alanine carboxypeptidase